MITVHSKISLLLFMSVLSFATSYTQVDSGERHNMVSMRMIGHEILLQSGDSVSLVLPIEKEADRYRIRFDSSFLFNPEDLVATIDRVVKETKIANSYLVEVVKCDSNQVIYSYEIGKSVKLDVIPCRTRLQPKGCYNLLFTIMEANQQIAFSSTNFSEAGGLASIEAKRVNFLSFGAPLISLLLLLGIIIYFLKKKRKSGIDPNVIEIGKYQLDKRSMELSFGNDKIELTSKEADLLSLLHAFSNDTLQRDVILKNVWGDEGGYVGRTLDVFISKLRKKLGADASVKIVNIRGQGYKLVTNIQIN